MSCSDHNFSVENAHLMQNYYGFESLTCSENFEFDYFDVGKEDFDN